MRCCINKTVSISSDLFASSPGFIRRKFTGMASRDGKHRRTVSEKADKILGYAWIVVLLCAFTIMSMGAFLLLLVGAACIALPIWVSRSERAKDEAERVAAIVRRMREGGAKRMRRGSRKGKLKHYEPNRMSLDLAKCIRTGASASAQGPQSR